MRNTFVYGAMLLAMFVCLLCATLLSACSFDTEPTEPSARELIEEMTGDGDGETVKAVGQSLSAATAYRFNNSWLNQSRDMSTVNRMNACLRSFARTLNADGVDWNCKYTDRAVCSKLNSSIYLHDCRPTGNGQIERCGIGISIFDAGYCLWSPQLNGSSWWSQHYLSGNTVLLASEPGYTNRWTNP